MLKKGLLAVFLVVVVFLGFVSTRKSQFRYERSGVINATASQIFPYLTDFKKCQLWNPFDQKDPNMKRIYSGTVDQVGSSLEFQGNSEAGSGRLEITKIQPNEFVQLKLTMTAPFHAENGITYQLTPTNGGTKFSWIMEGDGGFMGKLISVFIDCEKMLAGDFDKGISQLKNIVEKGQVR